MTTMTAMFELTVSTDIHAGGHMTITQRAKGDLGSTATITTVAGIEIIADATGAIEWRAPTMHRSVPAALRFFESHGLGKHRFIPTTRWHNANHAALQSIC
jgi:hypothetical protein